MGETETDREDPPSFSFSPLGNSTYQKESAESPLPDPSGKPQGEWTEQEQRREGEAPPTDNLWVIWSVYPMRESLPKAIFFWVVVGMTLWAVWWNTKSGLFTVIAGLFLLGSLSSFFLPSRFYVGHEGVKVWRWTFLVKEVPWSELRSVEVHPMGIFVSPRRKNSPFYRLRGFMLPFKDNRERVMEVVVRYIPPHCQLSQK